MKVGLLIVLVVVAAPRAAEACKRGTLLFAIDRAPIEGGDTTVTEVRSTGRWRAGDRSGCLGKKRLAAVKRAVKAARFRHAPDQGMCDAVPTESVTYRGAKKKQRVETEWPCGRAVDGGTAAAGVCVNAVTSEEVTDEQAVATCDAALAQADPFCEGGTVVFAQTMEPTGVYTTELDRYGVEQVVEGPPVVEAEVKTSGSWRRKEQDGTLSEGCVAADHLRRLQRAAKRAKFRLTKGTTCDRSVAIVTYRGAKKKQRVELRLDCDERVDAATETAAKCLLAVARDVPTDTDVEDACGK